MISDELRAIVMNCGETVYSVARQAGIPEGSLYQFVAGCGMTTINFDRLCELFNVVVVSNTSGVRKAKPSGRPKKPKQGS